MAEFVASYAIDDGGVKRGLSGIVEAARQHRQQMGTVAEGIGTSFTKEFFGINKIAKATFAGLAGSIAFAAKAASDYAQKNAVIKEQFESLGKMFSGTYSLFGALASSFAIQWANSFGQFIKYAQEAYFAYADLVSLGGASDLLGAVKSDTSLRQNIAARDASADRMAKSQADIARSRGDTVKAARIEFELAEKERKAKRDAVAGKISGMDPYTANALRAEDLAASIANQSKLNKAIEEATEKRLKERREKRRAFDEARAEDEKEAASMREKIDKAAEEVRKATEVKKQQQESVQALYLQNKIQELKLRGFDRESEKLERAVKLRQDLQTIDEATALSASERARSKALIMAQYMDTPVLSGTRPERGKVFGEGYRSGLLGVRGLDTRLQGTPVTEEVKQTGHLAKIEMAVEKLVAKVIYGGSVFQ